MTKIIKSHDFERSKNKLKEFSKNIPQKTNFKSFHEDSGLFGWFDHNVTGAELNKFVGDVEDELITQKQITIEIIHEFKTIYETFEKLDKDYIQSIIVTINSAKVVSEQAFKNSEDIEKLEEGLGKLVTRLQTKFSNLETDFKLVTKNSGEISKIKENYKNLPSRLEKINTLINNSNIKYNKFETNISNIEKKISKIEKEKMSNNSLKISILTVVSIVSLLTSLILIFLNFKK
jgi:septation ring formation regulator EzrA